MQFIDGRRFSCRGAQVDSHGPAVQQTMVYPQLHFLYEVVDVPGMQVVQVRRCVQRHVPSTLAVHQQGRHLPFRGAEAVSHGLSVQADHRDSLLLYMVVDVLVALVVHFPCRGAEADSRGPDCSSDHRLFPVACGQGGRCPYIQVVRVPRVPSWRGQLCSHSCTC